MLGDRDPCFFYVILVTFMISTESKIDISEIVNHLTNW